jgi:hypothetical protein
MLKTGQGAAGGRQRQPTLFDKFHKNFMHQPHFSEAKETDETQKDSRKTSAGGIVIRTDSRQSIAIKLIPSIQLQIGKTLIQTQLNITTNAIPTYQSKFSTLSNNMNKLAYISHCLKFFTGTPRKRSTSFVFMSTKNCINISKD